MKRIELTRGLFALVDDDLFDYLNQWDWHAQIYRGGVYAVRKPWNGRKIYMHRLILKSKASEYVDHIDGDGLNNLRENLRICSHSQNMWNSKARNNKRFKGVKKSSSGKWYARITFKKKTFHSKMFLTQEEAANKYDEKAKELFGAFARLNFPLREEGSLVVPNGRDL